jgi:phage tail tape-measure protein
MKRFFLLMILTSAAIAACKKDDQGNDDHDFTGTVNITSPAEHDTIHGGTSFPVTGTIEGSHEMHGYMIQVTNAATSDVIYENEYHDHAESFTINETVAHTLTDTTELMLHIEAAGDHEGSNVTKDVMFHYVP